jgi:hypothetical protein
MLQFFLKTLTGIIMGVIVWAPVFAILLYFLEGKWGTMQISLGFISGTTAMTKIFIVLLVPGAVHGLCIGLSAGFFQATTLKNGVIAGLLGSIVLITAFCIFTDFIRPQFSSWSDVFKTVGADVFYVIAGTLILSVPSSLIGAATAKGAGYVIGILMERNIP